MKQLELGMSTLPWYYDEHLMPFLHLLPEAGIHHLELRRLVPHVDIDSPPAIREFRALCADLDLHIHSVHMPIEIIRGMSHLDASHRKDCVNRAKAVAEVVVQLGARILVTHAGGPIPDDVGREEVGAASLESLACLSEFCSTIGLTVALENTLPVEYGSIAELIDIADGLACEHVGCCLDTSHANLTGRPEDAIQTLGSRLLTLHISDNDGTRDLHAFPFDGTVDWPAVLSALEMVHYDGVFMMEVRGSTEYEKTVTQIARRFRRLGEYSSALKQNWQCGA